MSPDPGVIDRVAVLDVIPDRCERVLPSEESRLSV